MTMHRIGRHFCYSVIWEAATGLSVSLLCVHIISVPVSLSAECYIQ